MNPHSAPMRELSSTEIDHVAGGNPLAFGAGVVAGAALAICGGIAGAAALAAYDYMTDDKESKDEGKNEGRAEDSQSSDQP